MEASNPASNPAVSMYTVLRDELLSGKKKELVALGIEGSANKLGIGIIK
jgi:hypothetical protein